MTPATLGSAGFEHVPEGEAGAVGRRWWDDNCGEYLAEHGDVLGDVDLLWGPEGLRERDVHLLGDVGGRRVLEVGAGAAHGARWLLTRGALAVATDVSGGMLDAARVLDDRTGVRVPCVQADARALPFAAGTFDVVFTAFGAIPFVPQARPVHAEAARVLAPGGLWVFAVTHPLRWAFPDDPTEAGLTATRSYFDRRPYVERDTAGRLRYAEYHRTVGDHVADLVAAGFRLERLVEPEWPTGHQQVWGGWGPVRGAYLPGTAIFVCTRA